MLGSNLLMHFFGIMMHIIYIYNNLLILQKVIKHFLRMMWIQDRLSGPRIRWFCCAVEMLTIALIHLRSFLQEEIHHGRMAKASLRAQGATRCPGV